MSKAPKTRRTQAQRTEASDKAMFKAAIKLIAKHGPQNMTLAQLGKEAGFSGGLVSYRFGSKSKMLQATSERILELWHERVIDPAHIADGGVENLKTMAKLYIDAVVAKTDLMAAQYRLMHESYSSYRELQPAFAKFDSEVRKGISDLLKPAQESGEMNPAVDPDAFAAMFIGMMRGLAVQYFIDSDGFDIEAVYALIEQTCDALLLPGS